jgi:hypothetical protein
MRLALCVLRLRAQRDIFEPKKLFLLRFYQRRTEAI